MQTENQIAEGEQQDLTPGKGVTPKNGVSKKQKRIAELVKDELRTELVQEMEARLQQLSPRDASPQELSAQDPALQQLLAGLQDTGLTNDPAALRLLRNARGQGPQAELRVLADLAALAVARMAAPAGVASKASHAILPSGGASQPDLRAEYERRVRAVRPGDLAGVMDVKREFRKRGLDIY